jgi:hypothetical protein
MFVTIPPLLEVLSLRGHVWLWFIDLTWVRFISRRPQRVEAPEFEPTFTYAFPSGSRDSGISNDNKLTSIIPLSVSPGNGRRRSPLDA